jgi:hypothetical protein
MTRVILEQWFSDRIPDVPAPLLPMLLEGGEVQVETEALAARGERALQEALAAPGRNRGAAFRLLVGDAFITYAVEALSPGSDMGDQLALLLEGLGGRLQR